MAEIGPNEYIEQRHGCYYFAWTRISLDAVVYLFNHSSQPGANQIRLELKRHGGNRSS